MCYYINTPFLIIVGYGCIMYTKKHSKLMGFCTLLCIVKNMRMCYNPICCVGKQYIITKQLEREK